MDAARRLALAEEATAAGAELALEAFREPVVIETKAGPLDAVTDLDRGVQRRVVEVVREEDPDAVVVGEEDVEGMQSKTTVPDEGVAWVVDPIDGTSNYVNGNRNWAVSVTAVLDGEPVAAVNHMPALGDTYAVADGEVTRNGEAVGPSDRTDPETFTINPIFGVAPRDRRRLADYVSTIADRFGDLRRFGCAQLALSAVASGELEAAVSAAQLNPWDTIAGVHLVRQAGGSVTDLAGDRWSAGSEGLIATNAEAHDEVVEAFRDP